MTLEIHWNAMISVADEMSVTLMKSAYSESVRESLDFSCAVFDSRGQMLAQSDRMGTPAHLGTMPKAVKTLLSRFGENEISDGDVFGVNDPYVGAGHIPDLVVITPVYHMKELVAFSCSIAHLPDTGGRGPGGSAADSHEIYEEGIFIPFVKLYRRGIKNADVFDFITSNVRLPDHVVGDIHAEIAANRLAGMRLKEFLIKNDLKNLNSLASAIITKSEAAMRKSIHDMTRGTYRSSDVFEDFDRDAVLKCQVTVGDRSVSVDYTGSAAQSIWAVNSVLNFTFAYTFHALKCVINPSIPNNEGCMKPVTVIAPEGTILNPRPPAALGARHLLIPHINYLVFAALSSIAPSKVAACTGVGGNLPRIYGVDPRTGERFIAVTLMTGGTGARPHKDGVHCMAFPQMAQNQPVEVLENVAPVRVLRREIRADSGGAGKFRGGNGQTFEMKILTTEPCTLLLAGDRRRAPPPGLFGGRPGALSSAYVTRDGQTIELHPKMVTTLMPNDILTLQQSGGGGYGDPLTRDLNLISRDLYEGYVTPEGARTSYSVVFDKTRNRIDVKATEEFRGKQTGPLSSG